MINQSINRSAAETPQNISLHIKTDNEWKLFSMNVLIRWLNVLIRWLLEKLLLHVLATRGSSVDAPPHDRRRGQQTNHRARCRRGGGVTQIRVAALEGETGNLGEHLGQSTVLTVWILETLTVSHSTSLVECQTGVVIATVSLFGAAGCVVLTAVTPDGWSQSDQSGADQQTDPQGALHFHLSTAHTLIQEQQ